MKDFTLSIYQVLLSTLKYCNYQFQTFHQALEYPAERVAVLRHDVDARKRHALHFARLQQKMDLVGTYYFRMIPQSFDKDIIREIASMGHEVGYHYEDLDRARGDHLKAIGYFEQNLERLRKIAPVTTICMHGSPRSKYDNRDLWQYFDYRDYGIVGEPYFDLDFNTFFYLTDTGRRWDGHKVAIRDKVENHFELSFHSTAEIIQSLNEAKFPEKVMFNFHPQRWTNHKILWLQEKGFQQLKNMVKYWMIKLS